MHCNLRPYNAMPVLTTLITMTMTSLKSLNLSAAILFDLVSRYKIDVADLLAY